MNKEGGEENEKEGRGKSPSRVAGIMGEADSDQAAHHSCSPEG